MLSMNTSRSPFASSVSTRRQYGFRWWRALALGMGLLLGAVSGAHAQATLKWAPSGNCASLGGSGPWNNTGVSNWCNTSNQPVQWDPDGNPSNNAKAVFENTGGTVTVQSGYVYFAGLEWHLPGTLTLSNTNAQLIGISAPTKVSSMGGTIDLQPGLGGTGVSYTLEGGPVNLHGDNTFSGSLVVNQTTVSLEGSATLDSVSGVSLILSNQSVLRFNKNGNYTFNKPISGVGRVQKTDGNTLTLGGNNSGLSDAVNVQAGTLAITHANALGTGTTTMFAGTTLEIRGVQNVTSGSVVLAGSTLKGSTGYSSLNTQVNITGNSTIDVDSGWNLSFIGAQGDGARGINGSAAVTKTGAGNLFLYSDSPHTGSVTVSQGMLLVNGTLASSSNAVTVASGATLSGNGTINRPLTLNSGSTLWPGGTTDPSQSASVGTFKLGNASSTLTLNSGAQVNFQLGEKDVFGGSYNDLVDVTGHISFDANATLNLSVTSGRTLQSGNYPLFRYTGTRTGVPKLGTVPTGWFATLNTSTAGVVSVDLVPATLYWATGATCPGGYGGAGDWHTNPTPMNWCDANGNKRAWIDGATAVFSGAPDTVTVIGSPSFNALDFQVSGMTITGGTLTGTIGTQTELKAGADITATINSVLAGGLPYTKTGNGTVELEASSSFNTPLHISEGKLQVGTGGTSGSINPASVTVASGAFLRFNRSDSVTFSKVIDGAGGLEKLGAGTLVLTGNNTYAGGTTVMPSGGTLQIGDGTTSNSGTVGTGSVTINSSAFVAVNRPDNLSLSAPLAGTGTLTKQGAGTLTLGGSNTGFSGQANVSAGTLAITNANALGSPASNTTVAGLATLDLSGVSAVVGPVTLNGGSLRTNSAVASSLAGQLTVSATSSIDVTGAELTLSGNITGGSDLFKNGTGSLVVSGTSNTHTGRVRISNGTLWVNGNVGPSPLGRTVSVEGGTLGGSGTIDRAVTMNVTTSSKLEPGATVGAGGTLRTGNFTANNTSILNFLLGSPAPDLVEVTGDLLFNGTVTVNITTSSGSLGVGVYPLFKYTGNVTGLPTVGSGAPAGFTTTIEKDESDPLNKQVVVKVAPPTLYWAPAATNCNISAQWGGGSGTWNTVASNQVWCVQGTTARVAWQQGAKAVFPQAAGSVSVADAIQFESLEFQVAGYSLNLGAGGRLTGTSTVSAVTAINTSHAPSTTTIIAVPLDGNLPHTKEGTGMLALTGSNTFPGSIAVNGGTLQLGNGGSAGSLASTSEVKLGGGTLRFNHASPFAFSNTISGTGSVTKEGSSTLTLSGNSSYSGVTTVSNGTLRATSANALGAGGTGHGTVVEGSSSILELQADSAEPVTLQNSGKLFVSAGNRVLSGALSMGTAGGTVEVSTGAELNLSTSMGAGSTTLSKIGAGKLLMSADNSAHTGPIVVSAGRLVAAHTNALGSTGGNTTVNSSAELELPAVALSAEPLILSAGKLIASGASSTVGGSVTFSASSSGNTIQVDTELIVLGALGSGGTDANTAPSWLKSGAGRLDLRGSVAQWMGTTDVTAGTLLVNGPNWSNAGQNLFVRNGAVIGGNGTVGQMINLQAGARLEPGNPGLVGKLTMNQSVLAMANSQLNFQLGEPNVEGGANNDFVTHNIGLGATSGTVNISETPGRTLVPGRYPLIRYADPVGGTPQLGTLPNANMKGMLENNSSTKLISLVLLTSPNLRWAPNAAADCSSGLGGAGTWNATNDNWCPEGGTSKVPWVPGATAVFTNTGGVVTVDGAQDIAGLTFETSTVTLNAGTTASFTNSSASPTVLHSNAGVSNAKINLPLTGSLSYTKKGSGDVVLVNSHSFTGALTVEAGRLLLGDGGATNGSVDSASSIQVQTGAVLAFNQNPASPYTFARAVSGAGGLEKLGTNTVNLTGSHTYTGPTTVKAGTLSIGNNGLVGSVASGSIVLSGGNLQFNRSDNLSYGGVISGTGTLSKLGAGKLTLSGSNTYTGTTTVSGGTLAITNSAGLGDATGGTSVGNGTTLDIQGVDGVGESVTLSGSAVLSTSTGTSSLTGPVTLSGTSTAMDVASGAQLTLSGVVSGSAVTKTNSGTLVLSGSNTYTGTTTVNGGTLAVANISALGTADGTTTTGTTVANGAVLEIQGVAVGNERVALSGTSSTLKTSGIGDSSLGGPLVLSATGNNFIDVAGSSPLTLSGVISGSVPLTKSSGGRLLVTGVANTHTGTVTVAGGALLVNGSLGSTGALTVASGATLGGTGTINRAVTLNNGAKLEPGGVNAGGNSTAANTLTTNALTVNSGAEMNFQLGTSPADYVSANGALTFATSTTTKLNVLASGALADGIYPLFKYTGTAPTLTNVTLTGTTGQLQTRSLGGGFSEVYLQVGALNLYWTPSGNCAGTRGGDGNWTLAAEVWCDAATGGSPTKWVANSTAVFTGAASTVTLSGGPHSIAGLSFETTNAVTLSADTLNGAPGATDILLNSIDGANATISTTLGGSVPYAKRGAGKVTLTGTNTFGGTMSVDEGTLMASSANALGTTGSNTVVKNGATLDILGGVTVVEPVTLQAGGTLKTSTGTGILSGAVTLAGDSTMDVSGTSLKLLGLVSGTGAWSKTGTGDLIVTADNTAFTGTLQVNGGRFVLGADTAEGNINNAAGVTVASGAFLRFDRSDSPAFSPNIGGDGGLQKARGGLLALGGTNTYTGPTTVEQGILRIGNGFSTGSISSINGGVSVAGGAQLLIYRTGSLTLNAPISGAGTLTVSGTATVTLGGDNIGFTGPTTVTSGGTLVLTHANALGTPAGATTVNGTSVLELQGVSGVAEPVTLAGAGSKLKTTAGTSSSLSGTLAVNANAEIEVSGTELVLAGVISGSTSSLTKTGAGRLVVTNNANSFAGPMTVSAGTLSIGGGGTSGSIPNTSGVNVDSGATLRFDRSDNLSFSAAISGAGALSKQGSGTLTLTGTHSYSGATSVDGGTLLVNGNLASPGGTVTVNTGTLGGSGTINRPVTLSGSGASLAPGDAGLPGTLTVGATLTVQGSSKLHFQLDGNGGPNGANDRVQVNGSLSFSANSVVDVDLGSASSLPPGDYTLFTHNNGSALSDLPQEGTVLTGLADAVIKNNADGTQVLLAVGASTPLLSGRVFNDGGAPVNNANTGTPNDGVHQSAEAGLGGVTVNLSNCSGTVFASTVTDAAGAWTMSIPTAQVGSSVCVGPTLPSGYLATGASKAGVAIPDGSSSGGYAYSRTQHRLSFTAAGGTEVLDFGLVPVSQLSAGGTRTGAAGGNALHPHQFKAGTAGSVSFSTGLGTGVPSNDGWSETVYLDGNCSGKLQAGAQVLYPTAVPVYLGVVQGQIVCLLVQHGIPGSALNAQSRTVPLQAQLSFTTANPALSASYSVNDVTTVSTSQLEMLKEVRVVGTSAWSTSNEAKPGQKLEYRITIRNNGPAPISDVRVTDHTPAYTFFISASVEGSLPASLGTCTKTTPAGAVACSDSQAEGGTGAIQWTFSGPLNAGPEVELRYVVEVK